MEFIPVDFATEINGTSTSKVVSTLLLSTWLSQNQYLIEIRTSDRNADSGNFGKIWYRSDTHVFKTVGKNSDGSYEVRGLTTDDYVCAQINQPTITTASGDIYSGQVFSSSAFSVFGGSDVHISSSWEIRNNSDTLITNLYNSTSSKTSWTPDLSSLSVDTTIKARVLHKGSTFGESTWSNYVVFYFKMPVVNTPTGLSESSNTSSVTGNATFSCTPAGVIAHYSSQWQISTSSAFSSILQDSGESTSSKTNYTFSGLSENTTYYWRVRMKGANGVWSSYTAGRAQATTSATINVPLGLSSTSDQTSVTMNSTFSCTPAGVIAHYSSQWQISTSSSFSSILQDSGESTSSKITHTFSGLTIGTTYYWRVKHKGANGAWSSYTVGRPQATTDYVINTPTGLSATSDQTIISASCTFSSTPSGATHASSQWQISTSSSFSSVLQDSGESTSSKITHTFSGLTVGTTYYWRVRAKSSTGVWSTYTSAQTTATTGITEGTRLPDGSIVFGQMGGYWLACAPATKRTQKQWGFQNIDTVLPNTGSMDDPNTGFYNSSVLDGYGDEAPANKWCRDQGSQYFLPNKDELYLLYYKREIVDANDTSGGKYTLNYIKTDGQGPSGQYTYCWSSSEAGTQTAWSVRFMTGSTRDDYGKSGRLWVLPCTRIPV